MSEWKEYSLGSLIDTISKKHAFDKDEIILINTSDVLEGRVLNHKYVKNTNLKGQFKKSFQKGDILYSEIRPKNKRFAYVDFDAKDYVASTKLMVLRRKNENTDEFFIFQLLKSDLIVNRLQDLAETRSGTFPQITFKELSLLTIKLPPLPEQKRIAEILSSLDDKIELNNKMNKNLEEMAQAIFKLWFVDFEFPDQNGNPYKRSGGKMIESEIGEIPEGWSVGMLGEIINLYDSKRVPLSSRERESRKGIYPYYGATSIMDYIDDYLFEGTYLLMGEDGTVADENDYPILQYVWGKFWVNNHAHILQGKDSFATEYLYLLLKQTNVSAIITGAVQKKINQGNMNSLKVLIPKDKVLNKFVKIIDEFFVHYKVSVEEIKSLTKTRDTLLPKLMSGEIRV
jgi:type I restriction enzyme S subunit